MARRSLKNGGFPCPAIWNGVRCTGITDVKNTLSLKGDKLPRYRKCPKCRTRFRTGESIEGPIHQPKTYAIDSNMSVMSKNDSD